MSYVTDVSGPSPNVVLNNLKALLSVFSKNDLEELVQKTMKQAHETIRRLNSEAEGEFPWCSGDFTLYICTV